jgi:hypothetical protein
LIYNQRRTAQIARREMTDTAVTAPTAPPQIKPTTIKIINKGKNVLNMDQSSEFTVSVNKTLMLGIIVSYVHFVKRQIGDGD